MVFEQLIEQVLAGLARVSSDGVLDKFRIEICCVNLSAQTRAERAQEFTLLKRTLHKMIKL